MSFAASETTCPIWGKPKINHDDKTESDALGQNPTSITNDCVV